MITPILTVKARRLEEALTQIELSQILGISQSLYSWIERGYMEKAALKVAPELSKILDVPEDELYTPYDEYLSKRQPRFDLGQRS